jgi:hypothetical protein
MFKTFRDMTPYKKLPKRADPRSKNIQKFCFFFMYIFGVCTLGEFFLAIFKKSNTSMLIQKKHRI